MQRQRKQYGAEFKAKVALEAIKGQRTISEIASRYSVHPNQVAKWKKLALERLPQTFTDGRPRSEEDDKLKDQLYQEIGQLKVELDWLKKRTGLVD
jgi:transposase-like protein